MTSPVVSGAQGDGGRMDDETLDDRDWFTSRTWIGAGVSSDECEPITECRSVSQAEEIVRDHNALAGALRAARRELGDTRARLAAAREGVEDLARACSDASGSGNAIDGVSVVKTTVVMNSVAWLRAALGATDQAGGGG